MSIVTASWGAIAGVTFSIRDLKGRPALTAKNLPPQTIEVCSMELDGREIAVIAGFTIIGVIWAFLVAPTLTGQLNVDSLH